MDAFSRIRSEPRSDRESDATMLSCGLGWLRIALGIAASHLERAHEQATRSASFSLKIHRPPGEVYAFYRRLSQLPLFMNHLALVREADDTYAHWVARLPGGTVAWDTKITEDRPGEAITWRSVEGSLIKTRGRVTFASTSERDVTEVRVELSLDSRGNKPSKRIAALFTAAQIEVDLRGLKHVSETASPHPIRPRGLGRVPA